LQFWYAIANPYEVRYAYYPNPFRVISVGEFAREIGSDPNEEGLYEAYVQWLTEQVAVDRAPVVRYDLDFHRYREVRHPAAHFHLGRQPDSRWCVNRELTPYAFGLHIAKLFYHEEWRVHGGSDSPEHNTFDQRLTLERSGCRVLTNRFFTDREGKHFHFS
jgi:hypothetical protein